MLREIYTKEDFEDKNKMVKMEMEIEELREEKEKMKREIEELRKEKEKGNWMNRNMKRNERKETQKDKIDMTKGGLTSPSVVPGSSGIRNRMKAVGPADEYE